MRTICPKIFATLGLFATMSQMRVAHFALKIFKTFLTLTQHWLAYLVFKILKNWKTSSE